MVKPSDRTDSLPTDREGYQQALEDFAVIYLLTRLKTYSDADFDAAWMNLTQPELENLAAVLIQGFADTLTGKLLAGYLNAMRHGNADPIWLDPDSPSAAWTATDTAWEDNLAPLEEGI